MADRPILFNGAMVRAILDGRKTQTRRPLKLRPGYEVDDAFGGGMWPMAEDPVGDYVFQPAPFGAPGDILYVRETACITPKRWGRSPGNEITDPDGDVRVISYAAQAMSGDLDGMRDYGLKFTPSIHMPKWAARIWLRVTDVRVERVGNISEGDARAEGKEEHSASGARWASARQVFQESWAALYGDKCPWPNGWVWVVSFEVVSTTGSPE